MTNVFVSAAIAQHNARCGMQATAAPPEMESKLSEIWNKLTAMGFDFNTVWGFIQLILPMIMSGKFDWKVILDLIAQLIAPTPAPGPITTG